MENISFADLSRKYLIWVKTNQAPRTLTWYGGHITSFLRHLGAIDACKPAISLKPYQVAEWIDSHPKWGPTYKGSAIVAIKRVFNWGEEMGHVNENPIKKLKKPTAQRRNNPMKPADYETILALLDVDDPFRDLFTFVWHTGCRPQEVRHIEPRHVNLEKGYVLFPKEEAKGKRHARRIFMNAAALEIITRLLAKHKDGKLFRNTRGDPWTKYSIGNRMDRLTKRTGKRFAMYDARHGFGTRKLIEGKNPMTVAAWMGHVDGSMLAKVYSHVDKDEEHLKQALED